MRGIDDGGIVPRVIVSAHLHRHHMRNSRPVTVFATDRQLRKCRAGESAVPLWDSVRTSAVAENAGGKNRAIETVVAKLITRRGRPALSFGIKRQRSLEEVVILF